MIFRKVLPSNQQSLAENFTRRKFSYVLLRSQKVKYFFHPCRLFWYEFWHMETFKRTDIRKRLWCLHSSRLITWLTWSYHQIYQLMCITETNIFQFCMKPPIFNENHLAFPEVVSKALVTLINQQLQSINARHLNNLHNTQFLSRRHLHIAIGHSVAHSPIPCSPSERLQGVLFLFKVEQFEVVFWRHDMNCCTYRLI